MAGSTVRHDGVHRAAVVEAQHGDEGRDPVGVREDEHEVGLADFAPAALGREDDAREAPVRERHGVAPLQCGFLVAEEPLALFHHRRRLLGRRIAHALREHLVDVGVLARETVAKAQADGAAGAGAAFLRDAHDLAAGGREQERHDAVALSRLRNRVALGFRVTEVDTHRLEVEVQHFDELALHGSLQSLKVRSGFDSTWNCKAANGT